MAPLQVIPTTQDELSRIAESPSPVNRSGISIIVAIIVLALSLTIARIARRTVRRSVLESTSFPTGTVDAVARFSYYIVAISGLFALLSALGIDLVPLWGGLGLLVVVVAFRPPAIPRELRRRDVLSHRTADRFRRVSDL